MTLTEISYYSRKMLPFLVLIVLIFFIFFYAIKLFFLYLQLNRPKSLSINPIFNKISQPKISGASSSAGLNFTLDTIEGEPITATETAKIYFLPASASRFGVREKAYLIAKAFSYDTTVVKHSLINDSNYVFNDEKQNLSIDITNFNFKYVYQFAGDKNLFDNTRIPTKREIEEKATSFLKQINRYPEELAQGKSNIIYLRYDPLYKRLGVAARPQDANVVEIDFYRPDIDGFSTVSPTYFNSQNSMIMVFHNDDFKILKAQVQFFEKSEEQVGVYPVKSGAQAWADLKDGKGMIVSSLGGTKNVTITKMFYGYFDPDIYQEYLQPVYVFLGEGNFVGYVPAVTSDYLTE